MTPETHDAENVPAEIRESGWQWRPVDGDAAFAPPFGTVRVCLDCGCLVAGGPTRCRRCAADVVPDGSFGAAGVRDPEAPCEEYDASAPTGGGYQDCEGDGHYLCLQCKHIAAAAAARMER